MSDVPPDYTAIASCRLCSSQELTPLFSLGVQFASDFVTKDKVHAGIKCPLELVFCPKCSLVQLRHTARQDFLYTRKYWYISGTTQTMRNALRDVTAAAERLVDLRPGDVVCDIGSNDATLLRSYGVNPDWPSDGLYRVGVEPAENMRQYYDDSLCLISDFWSAQAYYSWWDKWANVKCVGGQYRPKAKVLTAIGMLYDAVDPNAFVADVAKVLHPDGVFIAQLMCLRNMLNVNDVGNLNPEHLEYYSLRSLECLFSKHGLEVFDMEKNAVNGESYRFYVRHKGASVGGDPGVSRKFLAYMIEEEKDGLATPEFYAGWHHKAKYNRDKCVDFIKAEVAAGKRVHVLGASSKGNVLLQWMKLDNTFIEAASERSPSKVGLYTVGTGIPIVSEEESRRMKPTLYLCLPYAFKKEIVAREREFLAAGGRLVFPLPQLEVVGQEVLV